MEESGSISIGTTLAGTINLPANGLQGQIILNASNSVSPPENAWLGTVEIGTSSTPSTHVVLTPYVSGSPSIYDAPYYRVPSGMVGGGAVGVVPFRMYEADCEPAQAMHFNTPPLFAQLATYTPSSFGLGNTTPVGAKIRFYGPVAVADFATISAASESETSPCSATWTSMDSMFEVVEPTGTTGIGSRTIGLKRPAGSLGNSVVPEGRYRVNVPAACAGLGPSITPGARYPQLCTGISAAASEALFIKIGEWDVTTDCVADFNDNGLLSVQDIFDFLEAWFSSSPAADFNGVNGVSVQDLFDFLAAWFGGCAGDGA